jgi:nicotinamidase-related amidase
MSVPKSFRQLGGASDSSVSLSSGTTALLVIDPQNSYATGSPLEISHIETRQKVISGLVDNYRKANAPIVWIQVSI